jgi:acetyl/propionyl-CoA carboxylase alpha subunit
VPTFSKLLIANRGEIARRIMRTARMMNLATVAVFSEADRDAPFVREADEAVPLAGVSPAETYLRADLVIDAARRTGADAVHPGYGFLSENAAFAAACGGAGLVFVGPPVAAIEAMGSKIRAKELMAAAGVPVLPGATVPAHPTDLSAAAGRIGFPMLVKAAFGGGGRGMRVVRSAADLDSAVAAAQREAAAAFGDGTVFLERFVESPRHIEVQVFGDEHGNVVHLFERECSIQRRHQKIIEEAPSPIGALVREDITAAAVTAAKAIGYVNAGTVEFVADDTGGFWFLEVNTRLQVEHPVTELVTGLDLVELQLRIAAGEPIPAEVTDVGLNGHAVEARLYAEDVTREFLPTSGTIHRLRVPPGTGLRVDSGYEDGSVVTTHYDAMLAKVVAWAPTRTAAAARLADALARAEIHGVRTNRALLVRTLRHPEFLAGRTDTGFLERHDPAELGAPLVDARAEVVHRAVAGAAAIRRGAIGSPLPAGIPTGFRNVGGADDAIVLEDEDGHRSAVTVRWHRSGIEVAIDGVPVDGVRLGPVSESHVDADVDGVRRRFAVEHAAGTWFVDSPFGPSSLRELDRFPLPEAAEAPGSMHSPLPGTVVVVAVHEGETVERGQLLVAIEAMKMEHPIRSPHRGVVTSVLVGLGQAVDAGQALVVVEPEDEA